jgi:hypothetical protein
VSLVDENFGVRHPNDHDIAVGEAEAQLVAHVLGEFARGFAIIVLSFHYRGGDIGGYLPRIALLLRQMNSRWAMLGLKLGDPGLRWARASVGSVGITRKKMRQVGVLLLEPFFYIRLKKAPT